MGRKQAVDNGIRHKNRIPLGILVRPMFDPSKLRIPIVASRYNGVVTEPMAAAAQQTLIEAGVLPENAPVFWVSGAWEIPFAVREAKGDGAVCIGAVLDGETRHAEFICSTVLSSLQRIKRPIGLGILTCLTLEQAMERAGGLHGNKGAEAAQAVLDLIKTCEEIAEWRDTKI